jgi:hypothetical protein
MQIKKVPIAEGRFVANGKTYIIENGFSIQRFSLYQKFQIEAGFGTTFEEMLKSWEKVNNYANRLLFTDIAVLAYNMVNGVRKIAEREPVLLKMCALFINEENEDRRTITEDQITAKLHDWQEDAYDVNDFFTLALNTIVGFVSNYNRLTQSISEI